MPYDVQQLLKMIQPQPDELLPDGKRGWLEDKECIVLDASETSPVAHWMGDAIRDIGPGAYLGRIHWGRQRRIDFARQF